MRPKLEILDRPLLERILGEAFGLLTKPGVRVRDPAVVALLASAGAHLEGEVAHIPEALARQALASAPHQFFLHDRVGKPVVRYGGNEVHFDPGSCCLHVLDPETLEHRASQSADLVRLVQVAETLPQYAAQATAVVCNDVPREVGDLYRLFLVLWYSDKPIVTGAFGAENLGTMIALLAADSRGPGALRAKPRAVFDVCPSAPLNWSEFGARNLVELARAGVPAQIVPVPLAGATAPVTLAGAVVQHAAEALSGITIHQLAQPGAPVVWGGAPAIFDMRTGNPALGSVETAMLNLACAQVGKYLDLPTHAYLVASDAKVADAQAGMESGASAVLGALAGINMISGAGMLDFLACQSAEKLVIDAEAIASAQRLIEGIAACTPTLARETFAQTGLRGDFLKLEETRKLFRSEQHLPSALIDRESLGTWQESGAPHTFARARMRVAELLAAYARPALSAELEGELRSLVEGQARRAGLERLPGI